MELQLHLSSWNATGIMSSASYLSSFLDRNEVHIIGISEHWLFNHNMHFLDSINSEYTGFGIADNSLLFNNCRNTGKGGVALLWHKSMSTCILLLSTLTVTASAGYNLPGAMYVLILYKYMHLVAIMLCIVLRSLLTCYTQLLVYILIMAL